MKTTEYLMKARHKSSVMRPQKVYALKSSGTRVNHMNNNSDKLVCGTFIEYQLPLFCLKKTFQIKNKWFFLITSV